MKSNTFLVAAVSLLSVFSHRMDAMPTNGLNDMNAFLPDQPSPLMTDLPEDVLTVMTSHLDVHDLRNLRSVHR